MITDDRPRFAGADVVVVGAGVSGLWIGRRLVERGFDVLLVERSAALGAQSAHSHGYLHRGYIYLREPRLSGVLSRAADMWEELLDSAGATYETENSLIVFDDRYDRRTGADAWVRAGLSAPVDLDDDELAALPIKPRAGGSVARTTEKVIGVEALRQSLAIPALSEVAAVRAETTGLALDNFERIAAIQVKWRDADALITGKVFIFANGVGSLPLLEDYCGTTRGVTSRQSYMLTLKDSHLPRISAVFPAADRYGLFLGSRLDPVTRDTIWLASNFISYAGLGHRRLSADLWTRHIARELLRSSNLSAYRDLEWGRYSAPKAEIRSTGHLGGAATESLGPNGLVALPTKLTLAPLLAEAVGGWVEETLSRIGGKIEGDSIPKDELPIANEAWSGVRWRPIEELEMLAG